MLPTPNECCLFTFATATMKCMIQKLQSLILSFSKKCQSLKTFIYPYCLTLPISLSALSLHYCQPLPLWHLCMTFIMFSGLIPQSRLCQWFCRFNSVPKVFSFLLLGPSFRWFRGLDKIIDKFQMTSVANCKWYDFTVWKFQEFSVT